jgi:hypothetical protein
MQPEFGDLAGIWKDCETALHLLTARQVQTAAVGDHSDGADLFLRVTDRGSSWVFRFTAPDGRRREMGLGSALRDSLAAAGQSAATARKSAERARSALAEGIDPIEQRKADRDAAQKQADDAKAAAKAERTTLAWVARAYHEKIIEPQRSDKHSAQWIASLEQGVPAAIWHKPIDLVQPPELLDALAALQLRVPETASRVALGKSLGLSATDASIFKGALNELGVSQDAVALAGKRITMDLAAGGDKLRALGVATKDSNGQFRNQRDIMLDVNEKLRGFKEGTDRNIEAQKIYGRTLTTAQVAGDAVRTASSKAASSATGEESSQSAMLQIGNNAMTAASGSYSSLASIPYVGPAMGAAAAAAALSLIMGYKGSLKSARGGYDIPAGVNPLTQLHEEEMVLPKEPANALRDIA